MPNAQNPDVDKFVAAWSEANFRSGLLSDPDGTLGGKGITRANVQGLLDALQAFSDWDSLVEVRDSLTRAGAPDHVKAQLV